MREKTSEDKSTNSTRERLISAALELLVEFGYRGATSRKIAKAAGVNEITLFRYFTSKDDLIATALVEKPDIIRIHQIQPTGVIEDDLFRFADELTRTTLENRLFVFSLIPELRRVPEAQQAIIRQHARTVIASMASLFHYYQEAGVIESESEELIVISFIGPIFTYYILQELHGNTDTFDIHRHVRQFLDGHRIRS